jgi:hypothetical protein
MGENFDDESMMMPMVMMGVIALFALYACCGPKGASDKERPHSFGSSVLSFLSYHPPMTPSTPPKPHLLGLIHSRTHALLHTHTGHAAHTRSSLLPSALAAKNMMDGSKGD